MVKIIAEIGCNHMGNLDTAIKMIEIAKNFSNADTAKFQKRTNKELLSLEEYNAPHPNPKFSFGKTYGEHREFLEFTTAQHLVLKEYCDSINIQYSTSVWDLTAAKEIVQNINPEYLKIPSASNLDFKLLGYLCENYSGKIHISLGMTTSQEEKSIVKFICDKGRNKDTVLYSCCSAYPAEFEDIFLLHLTSLKEKYHNIIDDIGISGHYRGIAIDMAAIALGANYIERHFVLDRCQPTTDAAASLEPDGLRRLKRDSLAVKSALKEKPDKLAESELIQRKKLKRLV